MNKETALNHPLFKSDVLHLPTNADGGLYLFLLDAIVTFSDTEDVFKHEVAHRVYIQYLVANSSFHILRQLASISHVLLSLLWQLTSEGTHTGREGGENLIVYGSRLEELSVSGGKIERLQIISTLVERIKYVERLYDMAWRGLVPICEIGAIDFAEGVGKEWPRWDLHRDKASDSKISKYEHKNQLFEEAIKDYPATFGGYHVTYGSFQNALRQAWNAYNEIEQDDVRQELLSLATTLLFLDSEGTVQVRDPIWVILQYAPIAKQYGILVSQRFAKERSELNAMAEKLVEMVETKVLADIPDEWLGVRKLANALETLVIRQWQYGGGGRGSLRSRQLR